MSTFGDDLIQAMTEALAHARGEGDAIVRVPKAPRDAQQETKTELVARADVQVGGQI